MLVCVGERDCRCAVESGLGTRLLCCYFVGGWKGARGDEGELRIMLSCLEMALFYHVMAC